MASSRQHQLICRDRVCFGSMYSTQTRPRGSKSQMCLHKILRIITTVPPLPPTPSPRFSASETKESTADDDTNDGNKGSGFDLNVGFRVLPEMEEEFVVADGSGLSSSSSVGGGCAVHDGGIPEFINLENGSDRTEKEDSGDGVSENGSYRIKVEETGNSLTLLVEAAKLIFGEFKESDESEAEPEPGNRGIPRVFELKKDEMARDVKPPNERKLRRRSYGWTAEEMGGEFEEPRSSPVVRSKRGRTQVLPNKYRDSVLEPLTRLSRNRSFIPSPKRRRK